MNCPVVISDDFVEQDIYNAYAELGKNQPEEEYRKLGELLASDTLIVGVESYKSFKKRIITGFSKIIQENPKTVLIVTHGGPIRCIFREIIKTKELSRISNGAIIELNMDNSNISIISMDGAKF